jgi:hypothetical protein
MNTVYMIASLNGLGHFANPFALNYCLAVDQVDYRIHFAFKLRR